MMSLSILLTSLMGSVHCVGMCGGLMMSATGTNPRLMVWYHLARGLSYVAAGTLAGWIGESVFFQLSFPPLQFILILLLGFSLMGMGIQILWSGESKLASAMMKFFYFEKIFRKGNAISRAQSGRIQAGMLGFFSVFLPCGWLLSFILLALSSQNAGIGALFMFSFWMGTVPLLSVSRVLMDELIGLVSRWNVNAALVPSRVVALTMIVMGLNSIYSSIHPLMPNAESLPVPLMCHGRSHGK